MNLLNKYRNHLREQNVSKTTIRNYVSDIRQYYNFLLDSEGLTPTAVDDNIVDYLNPSSHRSYEHYLKQGDLSPSTIRRRQVALANFTNFILHFKGAEVINDTPNTSGQVQLLGSGFAGLLLAGLILILLVGVAIGINQGRSMLAYELKAEISTLGQVAGTTNP
ncbi:hypothetical protein COW99_04565 [Candidatus Roizmanbacteria bacterium CG22_combo_CG10-13_8_21_14_all_38_20]|uniref:Core-binding (CB) domain-containing protein n=1 Tax=Candidatus Roizmanbacteria bacterium CG22_combo_CG10-13_8_21_14_all_38_20 TaxID=1974862 RepID=A0A2H0BUH5_9BACT|nr:MAG: hypothetical protein COW99_04565 [Candidatus Roizmanbacteria bacterium CG22_combo_CG10-13_8_21_14_all_38_20]PJC31412.1 MAG: hypothetical protein CO050_03205 [Candidatus Roizmanbacteria bacterium CG_4_9_14_0_2_um_filter_38_17]